MDPNGQPLTNGSPPRWARRLLTWLHPEETLEEVEGDLDELYRYWNERSGQTQATLRYVLNVVSVLPPFVRRRKRQRDYYQPSILHPAMLRNYVKIAFRNLVKNKVFSSINIVGLSAGLMCFAFIALWVQDELSYDAFNQNYDRIVRLTTTKKTETGIAESAKTGVPMGRALLQDYEEVDNTVRLDRREEIVQYQNKQTLQPGIILTDPSFFNVFSYTLTRGNVATALTEPYSVILTESTAKKYFGNADPMGQSLTIYMYDSTGRGANYKVTGITPDPPRNAHFTFTMLGSFKTIEVTNPDVLTAAGWSDERCFTYLLLKKGVDYKAFSDKITQFYEKHVGERFAAWRSVYFYKLQPLGAIHLRSHLENEIASNGKLSQVYIFSTIGIFILLLAGINYTNLATARSVGRAKEVGIKKVVGAVKTQLIGQYLSESVFIASIGLVVSLLASVIIQPFFDQLTGKNLSLISSPTPLLFLAGITLFLGILAGIYPAFILSNFKPVSVLKGAFKSGSKGIALRKSLVVAQFVITLLLITSIVIIYAQMTYVKHKDLGYTKEALLYIRLNGNADVIKGYNAFNDELRTSPFVGGVATSRSGQEISNAETIDRKGKPIQVRAARLQVDEAYLAVYGLKLVAGKNVTPRAIGDTVQQIILNEKAVKKMGLLHAEAAIGKPFRMDNQPGIVVGVVHDYHYRSLQHTIEPLAISLRDNYFSRITVKIDGREASRSLAFIEKVWAKHFPVALFDYDFVDLLLAEAYRAEERFSSIILTFSILSLLIACLGLYGLIAYSTAQKRKEISIRKTMGASVNGIVVMLSRDFLTLIVYACFIAIPIAWFLMNTWLEEFAYRISLSWWMFAGSIGLVLLVSLITVSFQTIKAALMNPVKSLRSE
jgi:putative ABC transport system permease protein